MTALIGITYVYLIFKNILSALPLTWCYVLAFPIQKYRTEHDSLYLSQFFQFFQNCLGVLTLADILLLYLTFIENWRISQNHVIQIEA